MAECQNQFISYKQFQKGQMATLCSNPILMSKFLTFFLFSGQTIPLSDRLAFVLSSPIDWRLRMAFGLARQPCCATLEDLAAVADLGNVNVRPGEDL